jgi:homoserine O-succinyltransferase
MPIKIPNALPATHILEGENIFVMDADRAYSQDIRPLKILILNLMPIKYITETQLLRLLGNTPLQVEVDFIYTESYTPSHTSMDYLAQFYGTFDEVRHKKYDGMIITGAPVENMAFEEVAYWDEVAEIMEWSKKHVYSTFHICWGAQAGLYYRYGIKKILLPKKLSGIYPQTTVHKKTELVRGFDDTFLIPISRNTGCDEEAIAKNRRLKVVAYSEETGSCLIIGDKGKNIFVTGHPEYDTMTLDSEYHRDIKRNLDPDIPVNYYPNDDPEQKPVKSWRCHANTLYANWLNYYVYQATPYILEEAR